MGYCCECQDYLSGTDDDYFGICDDCADGLSEGNWDINEGNWDINGS